MTRSEITAFDVPAKFTIADDENCTGIIFDIAEKSPDRTVFRHKVDGRWTPVLSLIHISEPTRPY